MARFRTVLVHPDERHEPVDLHHDDLGEACRAALRLAERIGRDAAPGAPLPRWVSIYRGEALELSVQVAPAPDVRRAAP